MVSMDFFINIIFPATQQPWSPQPLTEMTTRNISCVGNGGRCIGMTPLPPSWADSVIGLCRDCFTIYTITEQDYDAWQESWVVIWKWCCSLPNLAANPYEFH
jgi:hypothetical protein